MYIYKITNNVNGKVYIGKTTRSVSIRYNEHISSAKTGSGFILSSAMRKYGISNFIVEQIEQVKDLDQLSKLIDLMWLLINTLTVVPILQKLPLAPFWIK